MTRGRAALDVYMGKPPASMLASTLRRGRAAVTVRPGSGAGLAEVLVCESAPEHAAADWAALAARRSGGGR